jgi:hypothetical protein
MPPPHCLWTHLPQLHLCMHMCVCGRYKILLLSTLIHATLMYAWEKLAAAGGIKIAAGRAEQSSAGLGAERCTPLRAGGLCRVLVVQTLYKASWHTVANVNA